tara:strand:+ start:141 stop:245 length:105 start_codon:yes stop_codon:yes gene_type:complete
MLLLVVLDQERVIPLYVLVGLVVLQVYQVPIFKS